MTTESSRRIDDPRPGFFKTRLVKNGPFVGAEIRHGPSTDPDTGGVLEERSWMWETWINGELVEKPSPDPLRAGVYRVWLCAKSISEAEYRHLVADREWCRHHAPSSPEANPTKRADPRNPDLTVLRP